MICSDGFDETLRRSHGGGGHFVHGRPREIVGLLGTEWRGQKHDHADSFFVSAGVVRTVRVAGFDVFRQSEESAPPHRLHAGKQSAVSRNARAGIPEIPRGGSRASTWRRSREAQ